MKILRFSYALWLGAALFWTPRAARSQNQIPQTLSQTPLLHPIFSDDAVLQRDRVIPIWGRTAPNAAVTVKIGAQTRTARADASGNWIARVGPFEASALGRILSVSSAKQTITRRNVVFGEVWLCSGQSNMEMGLGEVANGPAEIAAANFSQIRLLKVPKKVAFTPQKTLEARWQVCTPQNVGTGGWNGFSAVAYFFGRKLHQELGVPIGLIDSSWGGTVAEAWVSQSALGTLPDFTANLARVGEAVRDENVPFDDRLEAWLAKNSPNYKADWTSPDASVAAWESVSVPGEWNTTGAPTLRDFDGIVLLRREIEVPADWVGRELTLQLGDIDDSDVTYWNGVEIGAIDGWIGNRRYSVPAMQVRAGKNVIAVRVTDTGGGGGLTGAPEILRLERDATTSLPLAGDWKFSVAASRAQMATAPLCAEQSQPNVTSALYNGMIAPLVPYGVRGAIWYQGESNAGRDEQYARLLPTLIGNWRRDFDSKLPFYIVQLSGFMAPDDAPKNDDWPRLRAAQTQVAQSVPNAGFAVTTDIGDERDIHPKNKQDVGLRLALAALAKEYGKKIESSGPTFQTAKTDGANLQLSFANAEGGLTLKGDANRVFAVAGADGNFFWATPRIEGSKIVLSSPQVPQPVTARFAWSSLPRAALYNGANLPAAPFSTKP